MRHIISLTAIPPRFADLGLTLHSLLRQKSRPEAVELWIPHSYRRFPQWGGGLPDVPEGVTLRRVDVDYGPATKVLPALRERRGQAVEILYDVRPFSRRSEYVFPGVRSLSKPISEITRDDVRAFRDWWLERLRRCAELLL